MSSGRQIRRACARVIEAECEFTAAPEFDIHEEGLRLDRAEDLAELLINHPDEVEDDIARFKALHGEQPLIDALNRGNDKP